MNVIWLTIAVLLQSVFIGQIAVLVSGLLMGLLSIGMAIVGTLVLCVGYLPALGWVSGAWMHLLSQWYERFLNLGGEPVMTDDDELVEATLI